MNNIRFEWDENNINKKKHGISFETFKAPKSLMGAPYLAEKNLSDVQQELVFSGNAKQAIEGFPKNVNVAVASALSSVGIENMQTKIFSCPETKENKHRVTVKNETVKAVLEVSSKPDKENPKSSVVTAWSVVSLLKNLASTIEFY